MTNELEKQFFQCFGLVKQTTHCKYFSDCDFSNCVNCGAKSEVVYKKYPQITDTVLLKLEEIFAHVLFDDSGFFDGFHVYKSKKGVWVYQLTHRIGGYYAVGRGDTRKDALLNQLIIIMNDEKIDELDKQAIKHQVRTLFEEG